MNTTTGVRSDIADRILAAADQLYEDSGRATLPTVDQVRRAARANMHDVALLMREWRLRRHQRDEQATAVPDHLQRAANDTLSNLWQAACTAATAALATERNAWEQERNEADQLRRELATACEAAVQEQDRLASALAHMEQQFAPLANRHAKTEQALAQAVRERDVAVAVQQESQRHLEDLRLQLELAHATNEKTQAAVAALREEPAASIDCADGHDGTANAANRPHARPV